ncbi:hypothetical protein M8J77_008767 [Diaphorina citri]|nr:hypothetical protein M8J77_008767 [Diaphorina citri]
MPGKLGTNDVHYLLKDELDFEIRLRQGNPRDLVSDKRIQLRRLINAERSGTLERSTDPINVSEAEIKRVQDEVEKLQVKVDNFTGSYHSTEYARLDVRLVHYSTRVSLWNSEDPEYVATKENLLQIIYSLLRTLDDRADEVAPEDVALPTNSESLAVNVPSVADNQPPRDNSSPIIPISRQPPDQGNEPLQPRVEYETIPQRRNSWTSESYTTSRGLEQTRTSVLANPINRSNTATFNPKLYQWRLRFSGEPGTMSVESFLDQLDMKRIARHLSWTDIFPSIGDLFQDTALVWYQTNWDSHLPELMFAINSSKQSTTGYSPNFLMFGREIEPIRHLRRDLEDDLDEPVEIYDYSGAVRKSQHLQEIYELVRINQLKASNKQARYYNAKRNVKVEYSEGDLVLKKNHKLSSGPAHYNAKLDFVWIGPCKVIQKITPVVYRLEDEHGVQVNYHIKDMKPFVPRDEGPILDEEDEGC